ncbi:MAG: hypothetical protein KAH44_07455 [Oricola sp.]|nr:hypothetical protein [Oricola sp.]
MSKKKQFDRSGISAVVVNLWDDFKRGAAAFHADFLKLFGFAPQPPKAKAKEPYAEAAKYPKGPRDGKAWSDL